MKKVLCALIATLIATATVPATAISEETAGIISTNCASIKTTLTQVQRVDARSRELLGNLYNTIQTDFILPLNLRLTRNNLVSFADEQKAFADARTTFSSVYTDYARELSNLLAQDCMSNPYGFHDMLVKVQTARSAVHTQVDKLDEILSSYKLAVSVLRDNI